MANADEVETATYTIESPDGTTDDLTLPPELVELLDEGGDPPSVVVGDMAMIAFVQQAHAVVHHGEGEADPEIRAVEEKARELFEQRLGISFEQATGHSH